MNFRRVLYLLFLSLFISIGCTTTTQLHEAAENDVVISENDPITIAVITALSMGGIDEEGKSILNGVRLAAEDFNNQISGHPIEILVSDSNCNPAEAEEAARTLIANEKVVGIIGPMCSSECLTISPLYSDSGLSLISPSCEDSSLTEPNSYQSGFFRTMYNGKSEASLAANFIYNVLGARNIAIVHDPNNNDDALIEEFDSYFKALGGEAPIVIDKITFTSQWTSEFFETIKDENIDLIYAPLEPINTLFLIQHRNYVGSTVPIVGSHRILTEWFTKQFDMTISNLYSAGPVVDLSDQYSNFIARYIDSFGEYPPSLKAALAYDAADLLLNAIEESLLTGEGGELIIQRDFLRESIFLSSNIEGLSGNLTCTEWGQCGDYKPGIYQIINGEWQIIYTSS